MQIDSLFEKTSIEAETTYNIDKTLSEYKFLIVYLYKYGDYSNIENSIFVSTERIINKTNFFLSYPFQ